jgi:pilus assembly protein CpaF
VDVRVGAGVRVHVVLPPVASGGAAISIRLQRAQPLTFDELAADSFFSAVPAEQVRELVRRRANLLITGAGGSGKTTLLGALLATAPTDERIVVLEDVAELRVAHPQVVALEARQANLEGAGAIGLERLVREALRMRPDRLVVGECRGAEVRELLAALNTGHDGGAGTLHANSLNDVPARLEALGALAGLSDSAMARQAVSAFDAVLHVERTPSGCRLAALGRLALARRGRLVVAV